MQKIPLTKEDIIDEMAELDADQHSDFFRDEPGGRLRMAILLLMMNMIEEKERQKKRNSLYAAITNFMFGIKNDENQKC